MRTAVGIDLAHGGIELEPISVNPGICTIFVSSDTSVASGMPAGRQCVGEKNSVVLISRRRRIATASGRIGASSALRSTRMLIAYLEMVSGSIPGTVNGVDIVTERRFISAGFGDTAASEGR